MDVQNWKEFLLWDYFDIVAGIYHYPDEYDAGDTPYVSACTSDNGVGQRIDLQPEFPGNCIVTGKVGCNAFYQPEPFCATSDVNVFIPKFEMSELTALFIVTIINHSENYRWAYGRQCRVGDSKEIKVMLPADVNGHPDWSAMESMMADLDSKHPSTAVVSKNMTLESDDWEEFRLNELYDVRMGDKFDMNKMGDYDPQINFVSRISFDNGVVGKVDIVNGVVPHRPGLITVALGGSYLGSAFVQHEPFYTAQNVAILEPKYSQMVFMVNLFVTALIRYEARTKYCAFGRELNVHINRDFTIKLPVDDGGNPDWQWMEEYMKSLPYSDRIIA